VVVPAWRHVRPPSGARLAGSMGRPQCPPFPWSVIFLRAVCAIARCDEAHEGPSMFAQRLSPFPSLRNLAALLAMALMLPLLSGCGYNTIPTAEENAKAAWSQVLNQYQRRADLIPNLVETVKG